MSVEEAVPQALNTVTGAYAIVIIDKEHPDRMIAARKGSPLIIGVGEGEFLVGSDATPIVEYTDKVVYLDEEQIAFMQRGQDLRREHLPDQFLDHPASSPTVFFTACPCR